MLWGHIYALTLAFFNDDNCIPYLNKYLDYYLTKPSLYFDQKFVMEAVLFRDNANKTSYFKKHIVKWKLLEAEQTKIENFQAKEVAKKLEQQEGVKISENYLRRLQSSEKKAEVFTTGFFDKHIPILHSLNQYNL